MWTLSLILMAWDSAPDNSQAWWVAYILGAFQWTTAEDNDPIGQDEGLGKTAPGDGGCIILLETIIDSSAERNYDPTQREQDTVVHEVGHAVGRIGDEPVTLWDQGTPSRYTEDYLKAIRKSEKPLSPP
jgi:hypothetical protein